MRSANLRVVQALDSAAALDPVADGLAGEERALVQRALEYAEPLYRAQQLSTGERTWDHALGLVHNLWHPIPREFDDYISRPKDNLYQSLHTAVIGPAGKTLEVQIRTEAMHRQAEYGVAAHWQYKEKVKASKAFEQKIAWLRELLAWRDEVADWQATTRQAQLDDSVYVLTPQGKVIDLPAGAT